MELDSHSIGQSIKEARLIAGLTQAELAKKVGVSENTINRYEKGHRKPSFQLLQMIGFATTGSFNVSYLKSGEETEVSFDPNRNRAIDRVFDELILAPYHRLNNEGQRVAIERIEELTEIPKYRKSPDEQEDA